MLDKPEPAPARSAIVAGALVIRPLAHRGLLLEGEADMNSLRALRSALRGRPAGSLGDVHLDLAGLRFIDVACVREIIAAADGYPSGHLVLHDPPSGLLRIAALMRPEGPAGRSHLPG